jgi:hypothetical protein
MWLWIGIGVGAFFALSGLMALVLAAMLGTINLGVAEMHEELFPADAWAVESPARPWRRRLGRRRLDRLTAHSFRELEPHP